MIDWARVTLLKNEIGNEDFAEIVEIFIEEVTAMVDRLREMPVTDTVGEDLHALKGSALNLGFTAFSDLCQQGETLAAEGRADAVDLPPIIACYDTSKQVFLAGLATKQVA